MTKLRAFTRNVHTSTTVLLVICVFVSIGLFIASFCVPPKGVIDPSIYKAASLLFAFASLAVLREAIKEGIGAKLTHGNTTIEIKDLDAEQPYGAPEKGRRPEGRHHDNTTEEMI